MYAKGGFIFLFVSGYPDVDESLDRVGTKKRAHPTRLIRSTPDEARSKRSVRYAHELPVCLFHRLHYMPRPFRAHSAHDACSVHCHRSMGYNPLHRILRAKSDRLLALHYSRTLGSIHA